jgi:hypothetical protein
MNCDEFHTLITVRIWQEDTGVDNTVSFIPDPLVLKYDKKETMRGRRDDQRSDE